MAAFRRIPALIVIMSVGYVHAQRIGQIPRADTPVYAVGLGGTTQDTAPNQSPKKKKREASGGENITVSDPCR